MDAWMYLRPIGIAIAACVVLMGCGQSGPLTLPEDTAGNGVQDEGIPQDDEQEEDEQE